MKKNYSRYSKDSMDMRSFIDQVKFTGKYLKEAFEGNPEEMQEVPQQEGDELYPEDEMQSGMEEEEAGKQYVDQIRKAAIQGIASFANNVDSPSYEFFKKVFMMSDKVLSEKENNEEV